MGHRFRQGTIPLLVSFPHNGSRISDSVSETMTEAGKRSLDTDWFLDRLYDLPELQDASLIVAEQSRYVIDLNRPENNDSLYPGKTTTGLIPKTRFDGLPIYKVRPDEAEISRRIEQIWRPYHCQIELELNRMVSQHSVAVLIEAHSIASQVPMLFDGKLPDFNIGTNQKQSCSTELTNGIVSVLEGQTQYSHVINGRFVGGYITRQFGQPQANRHAIQFELSQATYLKESTKQWDESKASSVQALFSKILKEIIAWIQRQ